MDLYCPVCGEPWENDFLHEQAHASGETYKAVARAFRSTGCEALGQRHGSGTAPHGIGIIYELSGDDMDGAAADLEDMHDLIWGDYE